jgi:hypothetical protein
MKTLQLFIQDVKKEGLVMYEIKSGKQVRTCTKPMDFKGKPNIW